jgi:predicted DNA-binding transcriptional regulator AlpA
MVFTKAEHLCPAVDPRKVRMSSRSSQMNGTQSSDRELVAVDGSIASCPLRLTYRLNEIAGALGVCRRTIERERAAGRFPKPDLKIGKAPLWTKETIAKWIASGGDER